MFTASDGLSIAFAVSNRPNSVEQLEYDDEIATMKAYYVREGYQNQENGKIPVAVRKCESKELSGPKSLFYPIQALFQSSIYQVKPLLWCFEDA